MSPVITAVILLGSIGALSAFILYGISLKFEIKEDLRIAKIAELLPASNCGACGYPGCGGFATACVKSAGLDRLYCPVGGYPTMEKIADLLGIQVLRTEPEIAVLRCNGACSDRPKTNRYDGSAMCVVAASFYGGETGCFYGCLGMGDCVNACVFDAIRMNPDTRLPEIDENKCTACGACVKVCPKLLIQLRRKGPGSKRIFVSCMNREKGSLIRSACNVACIGCSKCVKVCPYEAITLEENLAYIDDRKCRLCRKCALVCPTSAILEINFPPEKVENV